VPGGNGGSGKVVLVEKEGSYASFQNLSGRWSLRSHFAYKSQGNWSS
jgi:hypothetical protein